MARKTRSDQYEVIKRRLDSSARWRDEMGYDGLWRRMTDLYRGKHWPRTTVYQEDMIAVNLAFSTINVIAPSVSVNHPKIVVTPNEPDNKDRAVFVEAVINHLWKHHDFRKPFRRAVKDFLIFGHSWIKVGWKFLEQDARWVKPSVKKCTTRLCWRPTSSLWRNRCWPVVCRPMMRWRRTFLRRR